MDTAMVEEVYKNVRREAGCFASKRGNLIDPGDALSAATAGYVQAVVSWRPYKATPGALWSWAKPRVRGAMLDEVRRVLHTDRSSGESRFMQLDPVLIEPRLSYHNDADPWVVSALSVLAKRQREVVERRYWLGQSYAEIAEAMGYANDSGPKQAHDRAIQILRGYLE